MSNVIRRKAFLIQVPGRVMYDYITSEKYPTVQELLKVYHGNSLKFFWSIFYGKILFIYIIAHPLIYVKPEY